MTFEDAILSCDESALRIKDEKVCDESLEERLARMVQENDFGGVLALGQLQRCTLKEQARGPILTQRSSSSLSVPKHWDRWEDGTQSEYAK
jgi:hypothetical protein